MGAALRMVHLDLITMKPYLKSYVILLALALFMAYLDVGSAFVTIVLTVYLLMMSGSIFSVQEKNKLDRLYSSLSVDGRSIVLGRYLFTLLHGFAAIAISFVVSVAMTLLRDMPLDPGAFLAGAAVALATLFVFSGIQLPIYFRLGYTKARFIVMVPFLLLAFGIPVLFTIFPQFGEFSSALLAQVESNIVLFAILGFVAAMLLYVGSYCLSIRMRRKNLR